MQYCRCFFVASRCFGLTMYRKKFCNDSKPKILAETHFIYFFAFSIPQCYKIEMKKEPVMIPLFRTRQDQDSFEVFDWTLEISNQIQKYSR